MFSGRNDKVEGDGQPLHEWKWMDRVKKRWTSLISSDGYSRSLTLPRSGMTKLRAVALMPQVSPLSSLACRVSTTDRRRVYETASWLERSTSFAFWNSLPS